MTDTFLDIIKDTSIIIGTATKSVVDAPYDAIRAANFNSYTHEWSLKWGPTEPTKGTVTLNADAQYVIDAATSGGKRLKGHALVWYQALPSWYSVLSVSEKKNAIEFHVRTLVDRLKGVVQKWDVVNEAFEDTSQAGYRSFWTELGGIEMVRQCFVWAREADPNAVLVYNDYDCTSMTKKADAIYDMVKELKRTGTPIDEVGFQAHESIHLMNDAWFASMRQNIQRFKALGVRVNISEVDLRIDLYPGSLSEKLNRQAMCFYHLILEALCDLSACNEVTFWQFSSKYTWIYDAFGVDSSNTPCPWDNNNVPTPAVDAIKRALRHVVLLSRLSKRRSYWKMTS